LIHIDIETRSRLDLKRNGVYRYVECPDFAVLMAAYSIDGGPVQVAVGEADIYEIPGLWDDEIVAFNAQFERICLGHLGGLPFDSKYLHPERFRDPMAIAGERGYPQSLGALAKALGVPEKDEAGTRLINLFSKPNKKGGFNDATTHPQEWEEFIAYCKQDVETLIAVDRKLTWPTETERRVWEIDQRINDLGIPFDRQMVELAMRAAEDNVIESKARITELTGVANPASQPQMMKWAVEVGLDLPNLRAATIEQVLESGDLDDVEREVLSTRSEVALASSKKYAAILDYASSDDRVRGAFRFFGAHTGRWSGRGPQLHNLPRASLGSDSQVEAALLDLQMGLGGSPNTLKALVRSSFVGPFTVVDYASIEARVLAWLAGERWALQAFADGRDIYVETANRMGEGFTRQQGKVAVLALGYQGGINALRVMGAEGSDDDLQELVTQWRQANRRITLLWQSMNEALSEGGRVGPFLRVTRKHGAMDLHLPSGRAIHYHGLRWEPYVTKDPVTDEPIRKEGWRYADPKRGGARIGTWGGRLVENATQAVARDLLAEALVRLHDQGFQVVAHVHDEILVEGDHDVDEITKIMCTLPTWAAALPIDGEGSVMRRYRK